MNVTNLSTLVKQIPFCGIILELCCKINPSITRVNETKHLNFILYIFIISFQDVLLLADVMETFKKMCIAHYGLDPVHYYTVPGLALDPALKLTRVELLTDLEMYMCIYV